MEALASVANIIILIGAVLGAVSAIAAMCGKPIRFYRKRHEKEIKEQREKMLKDFTEKVHDDIQPQFDDIKKQLSEQQKTNETLVITTKDLLRKSILSIYNDHKHERKLSESERELLDTLYNDYRAEHGNGYIENKYKRMEKWDVFPDED